MAFQHVSRGRSALWWLLGSHVGAETVGKVKRGAVCPKPRLCDFGGKVSFQLPLL